MNDLYTYTFNYNRIIRSVVLLIVEIIIELLHSHARDNATAESEPSCHQTLMTYTHTHTQRSAQHMKG